MQSSSSLAAGQFGDNSIVLFFQDRDQHLKRAYYSNSTGNILGNMSANLSFQPLAPNSSLSLDIANLCFNQVQGVCFSAEIVCARYSYLGLLNL